MDFFLDNSQTYNDQVNEALDRLKEGELVWDEENDFVKAKEFTTLKVGYKDSDVLLKLDFVNDLVPHFHGIQKTDLFYRTDSILNILSNKLSAIYRYAAKDVVDIWAIAKHETINWPEIIREARQKEGGFEVTYACEILKGIPQEKFESIAWIEKPDWSTFCEDIRQIVNEMLVG